MRDPAAYVSEVDAIRAISSANDRSCDVLIIAEQCEEVSRHTLLDPADLVGAEDLRLAAAAVRAARPGRLGW